MTDVLKIMEFGLLRSRKGVFMDQPTNLNLHITGTKQNVMQAANAAVRIINRDCPREYFENRVKNTLENNFKPTGDSDMAEFSLNTESYWAVSEEDISAIADAIVQASPDVKFHLSACITITYEEGYDLCVDVDYADGEMSVDTSEEPYEDWDEDEEEDDE